MNSINRLYLIIILFGALTIVSLVLFQNSLFTNGTINENSTHNTIMGTSAMRISFLYAEGIIVVFVLLLLSFLKLHQKQIKNLTELSNQKIKELEAQKNHFITINSFNNKPSFQSSHVLNGLMSEYSEQENVDINKLLTINALNNSKQIINSFNKKKDDEKLGELYHEESSEVISQNRDNLHSSRSRISEGHPLVEKARAKILENIDNSEYNIYNLCNDMGMSRMQLYRKFKLLTDTTVNCFIRKVRLYKAAELIETGQYSIKEVTYDVGFSDLRYFRKCFYEEFGVTPSKYRENLIAMSNQIS